MNPEPIQVDYLEPPEEPVLDGWEQTRTKRSLLPGALVGVALLLLWRLLGVTWLRDGAVKDGLLPVLVGGVLPSVFVLVWPIWMTRRAGGRVFERWPGIRGLLVEAAIAFGTLIIVYMVNITLAVIYTAVAHEDPGVPDQFREVVSADSLPALLVLAIMACIWAPIAEELFFRRFLLRALAGRMRLPAAIALQAFLFAILHDYGSFHLVLIFALGVAMGVLYAWRRTIITPMLLHAMQNTTAISFLALLILLHHLAPDPGFEFEQVEGGCRVTRVEQGSAAAEIGLQPGDIITHVDGQRVRDAITMRVVLVARGGNSNLRLTVIRDGETMQLKPAAEAKDDPRLKTPRGRIRKKVPGL